MREYFFFCMSSSVGSSVCLQCLNKSLIKDSEKEQFTTRLCFVIIFTFDNDSGLNNNLMVSILVNVTK